LRKIRPVMFVVLAVILSACASAQPTQTPAANQAGNNASSSGNATIATTPRPTQQAIAAIVNNESISLAKLDREVTRGIEGLKTLGEAQPADLQAYRLTILDSLIEQMLIEQAAAIQGITVTDAEVETEVQANIKLAGGKDKWAAQLAADRTTEPERRAELRSTLITQKMRDRVTASIGNTSEQVHARHILVPEEKTANDVLAKLKAGTDFAQLAAQNSLDVTTKQTGGDLGWFSRGELLQKSVEDSAFSLKVNEISAPVKSDLGYHIIQTLERVKDRPIDPETRFRLSKEAFERWVASLYRTAHVEKFPNGRS
jgi:parvulin-like peptidyl-prolyl isomerase